MSEQLDCCGPAGSARPTAAPTVVTIRSGTRIVRVAAEDAAAARTSIEGECEAGECDCPQEFCTDDVETTVRDLRQVVLDNVTLITGGGVALGTLYADDTLRRHGPEGV